MNEYPAAMNRNIFAEQSNMVEGVKRNPTGSEKISTKSEIKNWLRTSLLEYFTVPCGEAGGAEKNAIVFRTAYADPAHTALAIILVKMSSIM